MSTGILSAFVFVYGSSLWLGFYLLGRNPQSPRLTLTGLGLLAYALAVACGLLGNTGAPMFAALIWPLSLLPALFWTGTLIYLLPEETTLRRRLARVWSVVSLAVASTAFSMAIFGTDASAGIVAASAVYGEVRLFFGVTVILPMLALGYLVWRYLRRHGSSRVAGVLLVFTLFFALSMVSILFPLGWLPRGWILPMTGIDVIALGLVSARFDAFDLGEALMPDMVRSFDAALLAGIIFGGQVGLVILLYSGPNAPLLALLLTILATAIAVSALGDRISSALDRISFGSLPLVRRTRSELRETARAAQRRDPSLDPTGLTGDEFARLTRRALSNFGDLPRLSASPLINLSLVERRLNARTATDSPLERAAELKSILSESICQLKPRTGADFGTSDEWRYYNALYFPYVVGLKPYSNRGRTGRKDPVAREALEWFRSSVPERTLYNWQTAAARLVVKDLLSRSESTTK